MDDYLILCRTPLQAQICSKIIQEEKIEKYSVAYITYNNSKADRLSYNRLQLHSQNSIFIYIKPSRFNLITSLKTARQLLKFIGKNRYSVVLAASIDSIAARWVMKKHNGAIMTFDDGAANIIKPGVYDVPFTPRDRAYDVILRLPSHHEIAVRSQKHFTIYGALENIVPKTKLKPIELFNSVTKKSQCGELSFFIGQPFHEFLSANEIKKLSAKVDEIKPDFYIIHPRESDPIIKDVRFFDTQGEIAESVIISKSFEKFITIYGSFSSVLLNIPPATARKIYLSVSTGTLEEKRIALCRNAGCEIIRL